MNSLRTFGVVGLLAATLAAQAQAAPLSGGPDQARTAMAEQGHYLIGAGDDLQIFVWKNPELSTEVPVRPDGRITTPLVQDIQAQGKTTSQLAADLTQALGAYIQDPVVTVLVKSVAAPTNAAAIRVIGAAVVPKTVPYHAGLTVLDVLIEVGGLNTFASGNRAVLIRNENGAFQRYPLRLNDLVRSGDLRANMTLQPGDVIRIPERWF